ncbi:hypothetical protein RU99_GL000116 [Enterococcus casseliflavus]|nr:hypothetical protein RU99_GL000116 [Enterococcus casseliflavus]
MGKIFLFRKKPFISVGLKNQLEKRLKKEIKANGQKLFIYC